MSLVGMHKEAEPALCDALASRRRLLGEDHSDTLACTEDLVAVLRALGENEEAAAIVCASPVEVWSVDNA